MEHIELFAGCGGLSLGLDSAGFDLLFANELSPMAAETFAYNLLEENLGSLAEEAEVSKRVLWLNSEYAAAELKKRLRENPQEALAHYSRDMDYVRDVADLEGKLLVGSIRSLNAFLVSSPKITKKIQKKNIGLVSGGPPCQSFSLAGLRQLSNDRNTLPMDFADFVGHTRPLVALLENVSGIMRPFTLPDGSKHYAWFEVARAFAGKGYVPMCLHVNAKYAGAAQNRPRFIMLSIQEDVFGKFHRAVKKSDANASLLPALKQSAEFYAKEIRKAETVVGLDLQCHDLEKGSLLFESAIFSPLNKFKSAKNWHTVGDAIGDLVSINLSDGSPYKQGAYGRYLGKQFSSGRKPRLPLNHDHRANSEHVQKRFCLYQHLGDAGNTSISRDVVSYLQKPDRHVMSADSIVFLLRKKFLVGFKKSKPEFKQFKVEKDLLEYLASLKTKKQTQRVLDASQPAPAALSIPDDACHYDKNSFRTLTVREMARFQSFPDWFEFRSKVTTGGQMRRFEVPQYTQVGNAVPPLLGKALGEVVMNILNLGM